MHEILSKTFTLKIKEFLCVGPYYNQWILEVFMFEHISYKLQTSYQKCEEWKPEEKLLALQGGLNCIAKEDIDQVISS